MSSYAAINLRFKLRNDAPEFVKEFVTTWFFLTDAVQAVADLEQVEQVTGLNALKYYPDGVDNLTSMIAQCSAMHNHWCWRVAEDKGEYALYESKASCTHRSTDEDLLVLVMSGLHPFLVVEDGDILARVIYEDASRERVVVFDKVQDCCVMADGYLHKWGGEEEGDGSHPREESRYYTHVLADKEGIDRFSRVVPDYAEFYPPWNITDVVVRNAANAGKWAVERSENRGFGY